MNEQLKPGAEVIDLDEHRQEPKPSFDSEPASKMPKTPEEEMRDRKLAEAARMQQSAADKAGIDLAERSVRAAEQLERSRQAARAALGIPSDVETGPAAKATNLRNIQERAVRAGGTFKSVEAMHTNAADQKVTLMGRAKRLLERAFGFQFEEPPVEEEEPRKTGT